MNGKIFSFPSGTINMAPPSATHDITSASSGEPTRKNDNPVVLPLEPGLAKKDEKQAKADGSIIQIPEANVPDDLYKERAYQKGRLALAFRIFAKLGFDEGVAGHITLRVC
jgi:hypothetical protein